MSIGNWLRRARGVVKNAFVWGVGWSAAALIVFTVLRFAGFFRPVPWTAGLFLAARFGVVGAIAGGAFSTIIGIVYHGRRLRDINWVRFGLAGAAVTGVFVPLFLQLMNILSGDGLVPWRFVLDDAVWTAILGGIVAGGSMKLAQRAPAVATGNRRRELDARADADRLPATSEQDM